MRAGHLESTLLSGCSHRTACGAHARLRTPDLALPLAHSRLRHSHLRTPTCGTPACTHHAAQRSRAAVPTTTPRARSVRRTAQLRTHVLGRRAARRGVEVLDGHACRATNGRALDCGALAFLGTSYCGDDAMSAEWQPNQLRAIAIHDTRPPVPSGLGGHRDGAGWSTPALSAAFKACRRYDRTKS